MIMPHDSSQEKRTKELGLYEASINLISNPDEDISQKKATYQYAL